MFSSSPVLYEGGRFKDNRGTLEYFNEFQFERIKRFYKISHNSKEIVRAWQGHKIETKWFHVINGSFSFNIISLDKWSENGNVVVRNEYLLKAEIPQILEVPGGYLNGFMSLEDNSQVIVYSDLTLEDSNNDNYRFSSYLWQNWNK